MLKIKSPINNKINYNENDKNDINNLDKNTDEEVSIFFNFLKKKPHSIYVFGKLIGLLNDYSLEFKNLRALCVGSDFLKEYLTVKFFTNKLDCIDLDQSIIEDHKYLANKYKLNIGYEKKDIFNFDTSPYEILLLYQMDYNFSDLQLKDIISKFSNKPKKFIVVMSPSIFNLTILNNPLIIFFNLFSYIYFLFKKIILDIKFLKNKNYEVNYKRTSHEIIKLFQKLNFKLVKKEYFLVNNQNYSLYLFKN